MAKARTVFICQSCGAESLKWVGRCPQCEEWNSYVEKAISASEAGKESAPIQELSSISLENTPRLLLQFSEFNRVLGGGIVPGSLILIGGDPGIGKSTLLLQVAASVAEKEGKVLYVSGEESISQIKLRAERLGLSGKEIFTFPETRMEAILDRAAELTPNLAIIDSIQTMFVDSLDSAPGTVTQVRASAQELIRLAKRRGFSVILVGHVTKDGQIAGPRVLEHMVDSVLYFEGERSHQFRILRAVKNRFGPTDEIGVFEMTDKGLMEVTNPSALFLTEHEGEVNGAAVFAGMEGTRPMLVELQTLIAPSPLGTPRRAVVGWDSGRLSMVLAVLEARCGLAMGANDVYLNVAGGLRVTEPAADLAVAAALASSLSGIAVPPETVVFGEIGLSGEVRSVAHTDARLKEAEKLGFTKVVMPKRRGKKTKTGNLEIREIGHLVDLLSLFHAPGKSNNKQAHG